MHPIIARLDCRYGLDPKTSDTDAKGLRPQDLCKRGLKKPRWRDSSQAAEVYNVLQGDANQIRQYFIANPSALQVSRCKVSGASVLLAFLSRGQDEKSSMA